MCRFYFGSFWFVSLFCLFGVYVFVWIFNLVAQNCFSCLGTLVVPMNFKVILYISAKNEMKILIEIILNLVAEFFPN